MRSHAHGDADCARQKDKGEAEETVNHLVSEMIAMDGQPFPVSPFTGCCTIWFPHTHPLKEDHELGNLACQALLYGDAGQS